MFTARRLGHVLSFGGIVSFHLVWSHLTMNRDIEVIELFFPLFLFYFSFEITLYICFVYYILYIRKQLGTGIILDLLILF